LTVENVGAPGAALTVKLAPRSLKSKSHPPITARSRSRSEADLADTASDLHEDLRFEELTGHVHVQALPSVEVLDGS
jgi:hypothetical protein